MTVIAGWKHGNKHALYGHNWCEVFRGWVIVIPAGTAKEKEDCIVKISSRAGSRSRSLLHIKRSLLMMHTKESFYWDIESVKNVQAGWLAEFDQLGIDISSLALARLSWRAIIDQFASCENRSLTISHSVSLNIIRSNRPLTWQTLVAQVSTLFQRCGVDVGCMISPQPNSGAPKAGWLLLACGYGLVCRLDIIWVKYNYNHRYEVYSN